MLFAVSSASFHSSAPPTEPKLNERVWQYDPLVQPALLRDEIRASPQSHATIASARFTAARIIAGQDDRVVVIVGPCSIHSTEQAVAYATLLREKMASWPNLHIIMRSYLYVRATLLFDPKLTIFLPCSEVCS